MVRVSTIILAASLLVWADVDPAPAAFPGANGTIVFTEGCLEGTSSVNAISADGTGEVPLAARTSRSLTQASWSPDGSEIVLETSRFDPVGGRWRSSSLRVMDADGTDVRRLPHVARFEGEPAWSPDGLRIAYVGGRASGQKFNLFVIEADGGSRERITSVPGIYADPAWSPDGSTIAFVTENAQGLAILASIGPDGSGLTHLARSRRWIDGPSWAPDGSFILYAARGRIWRYDVASGASKRVISPDLGGADSPSVSPDGAKFAFMRYWEGHGWSSSMVVADIAGENETTIHNSEYPCGVDNHLDWQPVALGT